MTSRREVVEAHLQAATESLQRRTQLLAGRKVEGKKAVRKDPLYRKIEAEIRKYKERLKWFDGVVALNDDLVRRREEKAAQPKAPKEKKKAAAPAPKKGGGGQKKEKKAAPAAE